MQIMSLSKIFLRENFFVFEKRVSFFRDAKFNRIVLVFLVCSLSTKIVSMHTCVSNYCTTVRECFKNRIVQVLILFLNCHCLVQQAK